MSSHRPKLPTRMVFVGPFDLDIPSDWVVGINDRGFHWTGDEGDTITLLIKTKAFPRSTDSDEQRQSPTQAAEEFARIGMDAFKNEPLLVPLTVDRVQSGCAVSIYDEIEGDSVPCRRFQWHVYRGRTTYIAAAYWALEISYPLPSDDRIAALVELFRRQALDKEMFIDDTSRGDTLPLKDLRVDSLFTMRIPDWWYYDRDVRPNGHAIWSCWAVNGRPGRFLIANEFGRLSSNLKGLDSAALLRTFESHLDRADDPERRRISKMEIKAPLGQVLRVIDDEKPRPLELDNLDRFYVRYHQWFYTMTDGQNFLRVFFNLSLPLRKLDHSDFATLPDLIEREILALQPLPPFKPIAP